MEKLLQINDLVVSFVHPQAGVPGEDRQDQLTAVKNVSLSLDAGETLALVGESGCGKTVLCKSVLKLLCERGRIRQGEVLLEGKNLVPASEREMRACRGGGVAMVFQDPDTSLDPAFSVGGQIAEALRLHQGMTRAAAKARALELMELVQIPDAAKRYGQRPFQFSGGMRQRIAIAIGLAGAPKVLLADEPTTALDEKTRKEILILLKEVQRKTGVAILFITHDLSLVEEMAERVAIMKDGEIVETGSVEAVFTAPRHSYTRKLLGYLDYEKGRGHHHRGKTESVAGTEDGTSKDLDVPAAGTGGHRNPPASRQPILSVENLCKRFSLGKGEQTTALKDFSMKISSGEIVGLVGPSGCGKTTLARCIMGIEQPDSGEISIADGCSMQMIFQDSQSAFNDRMTVRQIIAEPLVIRGKLGRRKQAGSKPPEWPNRSATFSSAEPAVCVEDAVDGAMKAVELDPARFAGRKPYELSGGQRRRVAIARALIAEPDLIIADEPLTGLDISAQAQIVHLLKKLAEERSLAILFIAHDLPMVNHVSNRVIRM